MGHGHGLVALALITLLCTMLGSGAKAVASFAVNPQMRLRWRLVTVESAHRLFVYGFWHFMLSIGRQITGQLSSALIGAMLSVQAVTPFSIASRLIVYASAFLSASTGVLTPVATVLHAQKKHQEQRRLFVIGGRYCLTVSLFFVVLFAVLGRSLVGHWMGWRLAGSSQLLVILALGEALPMSQLITHGMIIAMARHKMSAWMGFVEAAMAVGLGLVLLRPYGLMGLCFAFALAGGLWRGVFPMIYGCWLVKMPVRRYMAQSLLLPVVAAAPPALALAVLVHWVPPVGWSALLLYMIGYGAAHLLVTYAMLSPSWRQTRGDRQTAVARRLVVRQQAV